jgi:hypothetical protein
MTVRIRESEFELKTFRSVEFSVQQSINSNKPL